ncbi:MAG: hypothetical protein HUU47_03355 [Bacteroidetes bacterium]|nr:hypothetical protein [Bacteroidota bacterium]
MNEHIQYELLNNRSINYQNSVYNNVNNRFASNDFDSSLFYQFYFKDCLWFIGVSIPELDNIDKTKQFLAIPSADFNYQTDNYGYFINSTGGISHLDSVIIDENNIDDYYVWVVGTYNTCHDEFGFGLSSHEVCDNDGKCEEEYGETKENCTDCTDPVSINTKISGRKEFYILDLKSTKDEKDKNSSSHPTNEFQESHLIGKYEIYYTYGIFDMTNSTTRATPLKLIDRRSEVDNNSTATREYLWHATAWGKNCDIKRCKTKSNGSRTCNKGKENNPETINRLLYQNYDPTIHNVYLILYENDPSMGFKSHSIHDIDNDIPESTATRMEEEGFQYGWTYHNVSGTNTEILKIEHPGISPTTGGWSTETRVINKLTRNGYKKTFTLDGEMEITIGFFD